MISTDTHTPVWLPEVEKQLQAIAAFPNNWDSYGARAPDSNKVEAARKLLIRLCEDANLPRPYVHPTPNGGVQFEWESGERYFELEIVDEYMTDYFYCDSALQLEETGSFLNFGSKDSQKSVLAYIHLTMKGTNR